MKLFLIGLAFVAGVAAISEYLPPAEEVNALQESSNQYLAPIELDTVPVEQLAGDGYRYKTVKRLRYRNRREGSELPPSDYLPPSPVESGYLYSAPSPVEIVAPAPVEISAPIAAPEAVEVTVPVEIPAFFPSAELASDGYRYKTVKRIRYRTRRGVGELPEEYLPPAEELSLQEPSNEYLAPFASAELPVEELADDGYRYKTIKRLRHRNRRDVNELASNDYLPPAIDGPAPGLIEQGYSYPAPAPVQRTELAGPLGSPAAVPVEIAAPVEESAVLADDGYRYKTVRRIRYRHRRDINELPSEYLPPGEEEGLVVPNNQYLAPDEIAAPAVELADDGYHYKTVKRLRHRNRRDVSELPSADYLPPTSGYYYPAPVSVPLPTTKQEPIQISSPVAIRASLKAPANVEPIETRFELGNDGYHYNTVRRIRYRQRRDVNELLSGEYLPADAAVGLPEPSNEYLAPAIEAEQPIEQIAVDGYRYKTVKKYKIKRH